MTARALFILLLFFGWCGFSAWYYNCKIKGLCGNAPNSTHNLDTNLDVNNGELNIANRDIKKDSPYKEANKVEEELSISTLNKANIEKYVSALENGEVQNPAGISFFAGNDSAFSNNIARFVQQNFGMIKPTDTIHIKGHFLPGENKHAEGYSLAQSRAAKTKELLAKHIKPAQIKLSADSMPLAIADIKTDGPAAYFISYEKIEHAERDSRIEKIGDLTMIYFPQNSKNPKLNAQIESYLDKIGEDLLADKYKSLRVTGYTDDKGNTKNNYYMGLHRAQEVQKYLMTLGCNPNQIELKSYGEYRPIADNETEEGRAKNRRVEIKLNY